MTVVMSKIKSTLASGSPSFLTEGLLSLGPYKRHPLSLQIDYVRSVFIDRRPFKETCIQPCLSGAQWAPSISECKALSCNREWAEWMPLCFFFWVAAGCVFYFLMDTPDAPSGSLTLSVSSWIRWKYRAFEELTWQRDGLRGESDDGTVTWD